MIRVELKRITQSASSFSQLVGRSRRTSTARRRTGIWSMVRDGSAQRGVADDLGRHARHGDVVRAPPSAPPSPPRRARNGRPRYCRGCSRPRRSCTPSPDFRMAVAVLLAGAAERHAVQHRHVVADHRGLADHEAGGMIEENAAADLAPPDGCRTGTPPTSGSAGNRRSPCGPCSTASAPADASGWRGSPCSRAPAR